jgi:hypothetical protein
VNALPTVDMLKEKTLAHYEGNNSLVIINYFVQHLNNDIVDLLCHADNINVIMLTHNCFLSHGVSECDLYFAVYESQKQLTDQCHFAKQFSPGNVQYLVEAFQAYINAFRPPPVNTRNVPDPLKHFAP